MAYSIVSGRETTEYKGMEIEWSGYNGDGSGKGHEYIKIFGKTTVNLTMKAFGYKAGYAKVHYEWGDEIKEEGDSSIVGRVTFDRVNSNSNYIGLDYNSITEASVRGATVKLIGESGEILQTTTTDEEGNYSFTSSKGWRGCKG